MKTNNLKLLKNRRNFYLLTLLIFAVSCSKSDDSVLAPTPPMGWNSWNAFQADINEDRIKEIADIMVSSGMRDAGYEYLVLDDGWMAPERNEQGELMADPVKFPGGMKAIGDYIHSKGLKFGIYECRGYLTCQKLPGSFEHEQTDMNSFAEWGVDYIKLDACYAEKNGRLSTEDLAVYHNAIENTGRPMILSISDFGNGAWAWGGKEYGQLWRTSGDIYPWIGSVYHCAETSGGDASIHPAFNGLWQFAGPGHWNDPDMLQVGNLEKTIQDRAHFSLWCILAAPLMAGNDLTVMTDTIRDILKASEVIKVNQDPRGHQGYKIYDDSDGEIYNKPLADGTTAVLLINKGDKDIDLTVDFEDIGLKDRQKVRDLWKKKNLGVFKDSYTAKNLTKDGHMLIRVGKKGSKPLEGPVAIPEEEYTISGDTYLSDAYYVVNRGVPPVYDRNFEGNKIILNGREYDKGLGCKSRSVIIFKLDGRANRFKATVGLDESSPENETGRFRILVEDAFGGKSIFDSKMMTKEDDGMEVNIDVSDLDFILLEFTGKQVLGNWADAKVVSHD